MIVQKDVVIVGAGPAGVGTASLLRQIGVNDLLLIDRHERVDLFYAGRKRPDLSPPHFMPIPTDTLT
nr:MULTISPECIES: NAD(P)-binding domain-containing protein [Erwiniaceae]